MTNNEFGVVGIFPNPVYYAHRNEDFDLTEKKEIEDIVNNGLSNMGDISQHAVTEDSYLFNTKLKKTKEFCEYHIKQYVKEIINPEEKDIELYITQSWLNVLKPGGSHQMHLHPNSIISGVFYVNVNENDGIWFYEMDKANQVIKITPKAATSFNSDVYFVPIDPFDLILFPSSTYHGVNPAEQSNRNLKNRISISFNTYIKGTLGASRNGAMTELILK